MQVFTDARGREYRGREAVRCSLEPLQRCKLLPVDAPLHVAAVQLLLTILALNLK